MPSPLQLLKLLEKLPFRASGAVDLGKLTPLELKLLDQAAKQDSRLVFRATPEDSLKPPNPSREGLFAGRTASGVAPYGGGTNFQGGSSPTLHMLRLQEPHNTYPSFNLSRPTNDTFSDASAVMNDIQHAIANKYTLDDMLAKFKEDGMNISRAQLEAVLRSKGLRFGGNTNMVDSTVKGEIGLFDPFDGTETPAKQLLGPRLEQHPIKYADGGRVSKVKDVLKQGARGWAAGLAGLPGDIEGLARMAIKYGASPGSYVDRNMSETPALPTSEFYNEWLPGGDWGTPEGGVAQAIGTALGGVGATKLVKPAVKAADLAAKYGVPLAEKAVANAMVPSQLSRQAGVIKAPGGNWLSGSVEDALKGLKSGEYVTPDIRGLRPDGTEFVIPGLNDDIAKQGSALNSWIDKQLTKYVKNDMATERDPVRALAERGVLHVGPTELPRAHATVHPSGDVFKKLGQSPTAKAWENASDHTIYPDQARTFLQTRNGETGIPTVERNPWLAKVPPETDVYDLTSNMRPQDLGFNHLIDELRNATNPNSGLPADLLLKYDALDRVSVPQAVERVAKINAWREAQKVEASQKLANNAATVLHKEYPEQGMKWVELKEPQIPTSIAELPPELRRTAQQHVDFGKMSEADAVRRAFKEDMNTNPLRQALKYEGDTMGHCVGGYCDDVASGKSRIYSLRDKKGQPHVTIEVKPGGGHEYAGEKNKEIIRLAEERGIQRYMAPGNEGLWAEAERNLAERGIEQPKYIQQIKGKGNKKPNDEYLPFVQDFVKSGKWSDVGDLQNTGLLQASKGRFQSPQNAGEGWMPRFDDLGIDEGFYTNDELVGHINAARKKAGYAQGGLVTQNNDYDPIKYAEGGRVSKVKDVLKQGARGWAAGLAGLPGDIEGLARMAIKYGASPGSYVDRNMSDTPALPTSEFYNEWLPGGDWETPEGGVAQAIGTALGGVGATKLVKPAIKAADLAAKYGVPLAEKAVANAMMPSTLSRQAGVIKAPGGNWLSGSVEDALKGLRHKVDSVAFANYTPEQQASVLASGRLPRNDAINSWIDKQLTKYVKNDMATERDPVRALAERGVLHYVPDREYTTTRPSLGTRVNREHGGFSPEGMAQSDLAKYWENASDATVRPSTAGEHLNDFSIDGSTVAEDRIRNNPWLAKVPPETSVHEIYTGGSTLKRDAGFNHLIDELRNATNPNSGLPADLLLKYDALDRVSVPQAVERVAKINAWREAQKIEANAAKANNAATVLHKEYPEQGMKWVELKVGDDAKLPGGFSLEPEKFARSGELAGYRVIGPDKKSVAFGKTEAEAIREANIPALKDALKYEGDTMGHCVGGYCDDVASGASRIFSLRDKKGQPHVTIEVNPGKVDRGFLDSLPDPDHPKELEKDFLGTNWTFNDYVNRHRSGNGDQESFALKALAQHGYELPPERVTQIKGKGNKKPNDEYLPFVQDFVKSGKWSDVGDLQNSGLRRFGDAFNENEIKRIQDAGIEIPTWASPDEIKAIGDKVWPGQYGNPPGKYAQGGLVTSQSTDYDPAKVDALVAQLQAEFA